eukprot:365057-Chlamydomonas_euryale.AAC.18
MDVAKSLLAPFCVTSRSKAIHFGNTLRQYTTFLEGKTCPCGSAALPRRRFSPATRVDAARLAPPQGCSPDASTVMPKRRFAL